MWFTELILSEKKSEIEMNLWECVRNSDLKISIQVLKNMYTVQTPQL